MQTTMQKLELDFQFCEAIVELEKAERAAKIAEDKRCAGLPTDGFPNAQLVTLKKKYRKS